MTRLRAHGFWRPLGLMGLALLLAIGLTGSGGPGRISARDDSSAPATLPADLSRVPTDAAAMVSIRVADVWKSTVARELRKEMGKEMAELPEQLTRFVGVAPDRVERLTFVVLPLAPNDPPVILVRTLDAYDRDKVLTATGTNGPIADFDGHKLYLRPDRSWALHVIDDRTYLLGLRELVKVFLALPRKKDGPLTAALTLAFQKHAAVVGINGVTLEQGNAFIPRALTKDLTALSAFLKLRYGTLVCDLTDDLRVQMTLNFSKLLDKAPRKRPGGVVRLTLEVETDLPALVPALAGGIRAARQAARRNTTMNNFKQLGLAFHNHYDQHKHFPPAAIYDKNGKPLLSWRVLLLPFVEEEGLFKQFHLDEPWDSEHNKKLLTKMPKVFAPVGKPARPGETYILGLVGKDAFLDPAKKKGTTIADIPDGLSNTIILVQGPTAVPWTRPVDLPFDADKPLPKVGGHFPGGFLTLFADGHVSFLPDRIDPVILKRLITRNERISPHQGIPPEKYVDY